MPLGLLRWALATDLDIASEVLCGARILILEVVLEQKACALTDLVAQLLSALRTDTWSLSLPVSLLFEQGGMLQQEAVAARLAMPTSIGRESACAQMKAR